MNINKRMNYDLPKYSFMEKDMPLDGFAVGGFNYGFPYENINKITLDTFLDPTFLVQEQGFLPPTVNAIGNAAFNFPQKPIKQSWQNSGRGFGMPVLNANPFSEKNSSVPKPLRPTRQDERLRLSNTEILAKEQIQNNFNFSMDGSLAGGAQWFPDPRKTHGVKQQLYGKSY